MAESFKDHFSAGADAYARFRPTYPPALFEWLATLAPARKRAWDCATGSGQAALGLADHFGEVLATDASAKQVEAATAHPNVTYRVAPAESSGLADSSIDLVTVAQAAHWFDLDRFYAEVRRVLRPGGMVAVWTYNVCHVDEDVDPIVWRFYWEVVGRYWPPERRLVEESYRTLPFPFARVTPPSFAMEATWSRDDFIGYLGTWSATQAFARERGFDPIADLARDLAPVWPSSAPPRRVRWPLHLLVGTR